MDRSTLSHLRHELCTPLNHIIGYSEILLEELEEDDGDDTAGTASLTNGLRQLRQDGQQLVARINDQLSTQQAVAGDSHLEHVRTALTEPANRLIATAVMLQRLAQESGTDIAGPDLTRIADAAQRLAQILNKPGPLPDRQALQTPPATHEVASEPVATAATLQNASAPGVTGLILVVDDNAPNRDLLSHRLQQRGHKVLTAASGLQALELLPRIHPDLILLDVMMPEMDGFETCTRIKATPCWRNIPLIFLTARSETDDIVRGFALGAVDYLAKPFHAPELLARVDTHLTMDRLRSENERLVRAEADSARHRSVAQMVAGVAHEINTPLGVIHTAADLITQQLSSPAMASLAGTPGLEAEFEDLRAAGNLIARNVSRAHKLVQDFKKVSVNQITDIREKVDLAGIVADIVHLFQVSARQARMEVALVNSLPMHGGEWLGYPGSLTQVLLNLLENAQRYAYPEGLGGKVEITLTAEGDDEARSFRIAVRDFGSGIAPDNLPRIFEPFFTTGRSRGGSGLGMAIVYNIVTAHLKGTIAIESEPGKGTSVTFSVPQTVQE